MRRLFLLGLCSVSSAAHGATYLVYNDQELQSRVAGAASGDMILLYTGTYDRFRIESKSNITISGLSPYMPATIAPIVGTGDPAIYVGHPTNITLSNLVIDFTLRSTFDPLLTPSYGINADKADQATFGNGLTLRGITIRQASSIGNVDAVHMSGVQNFLIEKSRFENWGAHGNAIDIVGAHTGVIRNNYMKGWTDVDGAGIQLKGGARNITVSANRLENAGNRAINFGGLTDLEFFEPGIYFEGKDLVAQGNVIVGGASPIAFNSTIGSTFRYNLSYDSTEWLGRILRDGQEAPGFPTKAVGGQYYRNRLVWKDGDLSEMEFINVSGEEDHEGFKFDRNMWYNRTRPEASTPWYPIGITETNPTYGVDPQSNPNDLVAWAIPGGFWIVNGTLEYKMAFSQSYSDQWMYLAIPAGPDARLDLTPGARQLLVGSWDLSVASSQVLVQPMSDFVLLYNPSVPEPVCAVAAAESLILLARRQRRRSGQLRHK